VDDNWGGLDDDAVARFDPLAVALGRPEPLPVREAGRDLVHVRAGVDADDVAAALERDVPHGRDPAVAARERRRGM